MVIQADRWSDRQVSEQTCKWSPHTPGGPPAVELQEPWMRSWRCPDKLEEPPAAAPDLLNWWYELHPVLLPKHKDPRLGTWGRASRVKQGWMRRTLTSSIKTIMSSRKPLKINWTWLKGYWMVSPQTPATIRSLSHISTTDGCWLFGLRHLET